MSEHDLFGIMRTTRSMRRLKPDKVPEHLIRQVLEAGLCAANGGNMQSWRFVVVEDQVQGCVQRGGANGILPHQMWAGYYVIRHTRGALAAKRCPLPFM